MKTKAKKKTKRNPQDLTKRNNDARKKGLRALEARIELEHVLIRHLEYRIIMLERSRGT